MIRSAVILLVITLAQAATAQISGVVRASDGEALIGAHVWLDGTSFGTLTDTLGNFVFDDIPVGSYRLVASYLGFESSESSFEHKSARPRVVNLTLRPSSIALTEVTVSAKDTRKRKKWLKQFEEGLFGYGRNAKSCSIRNPEAVLFRDAGDAVEVIATDIVYVDNHALGYHIQLLIEEATFTTTSIELAGKTLYTEMESSDEKQIRSWRGAREVAYQGSYRHFITSLLLGQSRSEGFETSLVSVQGGQITNERSALPEELYVQSAKDSATFLLTFKEFLKVVYTREDDQIETPSGTDISAVAPMLGRPAERDMMYQEINSQDLTGQSGQVSYLFLKTVPAKARFVGTTVISRYVEEHGYWSYERLADMLPLDYQLED